MITIKLAIGSVEFEITIRILEFCELKRAYSYFRQYSAEQLRTFFEPLQP